MRIVAILYDAIGKQRELQHRGLSNKKIFRNATKEDAFGKFVHLVQNEFQQIKPESAFVRLERKILESTLSLAKSCCDRYDLLFKRVKFLYKFQTHYVIFALLRYQNISEKILGYKQRANRFPFFNERKIRPNKALGEVIKSNCWQEDKISTLAVIERAKSDFQNSPRS